MVPFLHSSSVLSQDWELDLLQAIGFPSLPTDCLAFCSSEKEGVGFLDEFLMVSDRPSVLRWQWQLQCFVQHEAVSVCQDFVPRFPGKHAV